MHDSEGEGMSMATADSFMMNDLPDIDPEHFGHDSDAVALTDPTLDIDGDGILDSVSFQSGDAMIVATDMDGDGTADNVTMVHEDGEYEAWEFHRGEDGQPHWEQTDQGALGQD
ncbi:DUF6802 family protein [Rhodococcus sp. NPDC058521]|uniref:DUF6802 family protein n=1 Tax=Rhodococcus sp. NPDC058521 TaxID=3346536 RepID=UPI00365A02FD